MELASKHDEFTARGAQVLAISVDIHSASRDLKRSKKLPFPLLQDPEAATADRYGVAMKDMPLAIPSIFVVDQNRVIRWKYVGETVPDRPNAEVVLEVLDGLRSA